MAYGHMVPTMILDAMRSRAALGGPSRWIAAWRRTIELYEPVWPAQELSWAGPLLLEGASAVALGMYLIAGERDCSVDEVTIEQIRDLLPSYGQAEVALWESKVRACGHDPEDPGDPVSAQWRKLRREQGPGSEALASMHDDAYREVRIGPMLSDAIRQALADFRRG
jgi:hypothetical protein